MLAAEDDKNARGESKGFAGLTSLISEVDTAPPPTLKPKSANRSKTSSISPQPSSQTAQPELPPQGAKRQTRLESSQPTSGSSGPIWVLGITACLIILLTALLRLDEAGESSTQRSDLNATSEINSQHGGTEPLPQKSIYPEEIQPPIGHENILSTAQIRYCLAEEIRLDGAQSSINNYVEADVNRFNSMVADYNSRCGAFRYRRGDLESAKSEIEPFRKRLLEAGRSRFGAEAGISPSKAVTAPVASESTAPIERDDTPAQPVFYSPPTYETSFDCTKAKSVPESLICHDPILARRDLDLANLFKRARSAAQDKSAFRDQARYQWNVRERTCTDVACLMSWFEEQEAILNDIVTTGEVYFANE